MEDGDGEEGTAKRAKLSAGDGGGGGGEDRLSALPDDLLVQILLRVGTSAAARTSVLSRRWRSLWYLLPELDFVSTADARAIRAALAYHGAPPLRLLLVSAVGATAGSVAEWLPLAARRLSGYLGLLNVVPKTKRDEGEGAAAGEVLELPCFASAANLALDLGFIAVAMPRSGVFSRLTLLSLDNVRFHRPCDLGDAVSSPRSPFLKSLTIQNAHGLSNLSIHSESLLQIRLGGLKGLKQLNVVAPALGALYVISCFSDPLAMSQPVADISAPQLETLHWEDAFDPSSVRFGNMANVKCLGTHFYLAFGQEDFGHNGDCLRLLQRFQFDALDRLSLTLAYMSELNDLENEYLMEEMTMLPDIMFLGLTVLASGHAIGPSVFHVLRMSTSIRRLELATDIYSSNPQARAACSSSCTCDLPPNWKTEELKLAFLHEVEINNFRGTEHQIALVKQLFGWAAMLKDMTINFCHSITESMARKVCQMLLSFSRPEILMNFYIYQQTTSGFVCSRGQMHRTKLVA
ncbi:putative F-box/FBD/LRR-repeat protein At4g03220 [Oryza glaberrima]|uniref:F-box domain-containing protein n=1 Tax=Oryza glaberrima TaxID=4538 RepID=I1Q7M6_ORYGL|nr:putative F-box/FBD/LRR-repeat protein At4g03220 [Oryza glaberrima]